MADKIVLWRPMYDQVGHRLLTEAGAELAIVDTSDAQELVRELRDAKALWVRTPERVTADILDAADELAIVSTSGFGTDNIDIPAATERGILVVNHQGFGRTPVSEHSIMLMMAAMKQIRWGDRSTRDGSAWDQRTGLDIFELEGKTVGLVGLGYIGSELARKLIHGFNCRVLAYDPYVDPRLALTSGVTLMDDLHAMLKECRILCLCAELTDETRYIIAADELAQLPDGAIVVNAARGQLLDLDALVKALDNGPVAAAGLDVVYPEPLAAGHPVLSHDKIVLTPHIAGMSAEATNRLAHSAADQILTALKGRLPKFPLNPAAWDGPNSRRPGR
ncbi:MAG: NAD(P)-dependent oxidoreductase [Proteobacteria bacterium]|nr:NAD(P)-dependent oxidoreductase [Pseudomonadota bacterium]